MWEITIIGQNEEYDELYECYKLIEDIFLSDVTLAITQNNFTYFSIATNKKSIVRILKNIIYEIVLKINKKKYFLSNLNEVFLKSNMKNFIISSLSLIDISEECEYLKRCAKLTKVINIDTFIYFKANKLILTWERIVKYLNDTYSCDIKDELYLQFLKFLADNNQSYLDVLYLEEKSDEMIIFDKFGNKVKTLSINDEVGIIANLIIYSPQKVIINSNNSLSQKVTNLLTFIFKDKLSLIL